MPTTRPDEAEEEQRPEDHRIVPRHRRLEPEPSEPVEREDRLDDERAAEEHADEHRREARDDDQHRVAEDVAVKHARLG
jgi:hypothetical protein